MQPQTLGKTQRGPSPVASVFNQPSSSAPWQHHCHAGSRALGRHATFYAQMSGVGICLGACGPSSGPDPRRRRRGTGSRDRNMKRMRSALVVWSALSGAELMLSMPAVTRGQELRLRTYSRSGPCWTSAFAVSCVPLIHAGYLGQFNHQKITDRSQL
jgi:hypothetical protein